MASVYIGLGSNLGNRRHRIEEGFRSICSFAELKKRAPLFETAPMYLESQAPFLNTVIAVQTDLDPEVCLLRCQAVEREQGRVRDFAKGPRSLDIDLLLWDALVLDSQKLTLPHPGLLERKFVLLPLLLLEPRLKDPVSGINLWDAFLRLPFQDVRLFSDVCEEHGLGA